MDKYRVIVILTFIVAIAVTDVAVADDQQQLVYQILAQQPSSNQEEAPIVGAYEWIDAGLNQDGNRFLKHTCLAYRDNLGDAATMFEALMIFSGMLLGQDQVDGDVSDLKLELLYSSDTEAYVLARGEVRVAIGLSANARELDEIWRMVYENETWRWCGYGNPNLQTEQQQQREPTEGENPQHLAVVTYLRDLEKIYLIDEYGGNRRTSVDNVKSIRDVGITAQGDVAYLTCDDQCEQCSLHIVDTQKNSSSDGGQHNTCIYNFFFNPSSKLWAANSSWRSESFGYNSISIFNTDGEIINNILVYSYLNRFLGWNDSGDTFAYLSKIGGDPATKAEDLAVYFSNENGSHRRLVFEYTLQGDNNTQYFNLLQYIVTSAWHPNERQLATGAYDKGRFRLMIISENGAKQIVEAANPLSVVGWSSNGESLIYTEFTYTPSDGGQVTPDKFTLYTMNLETGNKRTLISNVRQLRGSNFILSPDGDSVATTGPMDWINGDANDKSGALYVIDVNTGSYSKVELSEPTLVGWSDNGRALAVKYDASRRLGIWSKDTGEVYDIFQPMAEHEWIRSVRWLPRNEGKP
ncbi:MAG: hypothetical protein R3E79_51795 [Caldilineaceae bacterium]